MKGSPTILAAAAGFVGLKRAHGRLHLSFCMKSSVIAGLDRAAAAD